MFYTTERLAILVDGPTTFTATKACDFQLCFRKLRSHFAKSSRLMHMHYFFTVNEVEEGEHDGSRAIVDWMSYNGYKIHEFLRRRIQTPHGEKFAHVSFQVPFTIQAMIEAKNVDHILLVTGDGNYVPLVDELRRTGVRVTVMSTMKPSLGYGSNSPVISDALRRAADEFIDIQNLVEDFKRDDRPYHAPREVA